VAIVNVREPLVLINPKIISKETPITYYEGCLSYPGKGVSTQRYRDVIVETAQAESGWYFSGAPSLNDDSKGSWEKEKSKDDDNLRLLESICVQHEIDHLNGITVFDRQVDVTYKAEKKIGRNELVTIKKGDAVKVLKYKKAQKFLNDNWVLE
jgi:peptide deformylase